MNVWLAEQCAVCTLYIKSIYRLKTDTYLTVTDEEIKEQFIIFQTIASLTHCISTGKGRLGGGGFFHRQQ